MTRCFSLVAQFILHVAGGAALFDDAYNADPIVDVEGRAAAVVCHGASGDNVMKNVHCRASAKSNA